MKIRLYTWKDVERCLKLNRDIWEKDAVEIEVYPAEIVVVLRSEDKHPHMRDILKSILGDVSGDILTLEMGNQKISISYEVNEDEAFEDEKTVTPLFGRILYQDRGYSENMLQEELSGVPVIAFHSYKGGVGRTLSAIAFAKAWSSLAPDQRMLIVDSDLEAPGLTWLWEEKGEIVFSYLDLLEVIQSCESAEEISGLVSDKISKMMFSIETDKMLVEHFFLPTYRYVEQLLDVYASPESIAKSYGRKFLIAETLSEIGKKLGAAAVLVDLRAGISEFSAPILFDPRVKKYIVSSTSYQSVKGTELLLQQISKGFPINPEVKIPEIFLTMVMEGEDTGDIISGMVGVMDQKGAEDSLTDNIITELPFASELVHLESLSQIVKNLEGREFYKRINLLVKDAYIRKEEKQLEITDRKFIIGKIHDLAKNQINAEGNIDFNVLLTQPIHNLLIRFENTIPATVIMGAKGAGKTFLYREMLRSQYWEVFLSKLSTGEVSEKNTVIVPIVAPKNAGEIQPMISGCLENYASLWGRGENSSLLRPSFCMDNAREIAKFSREMHDKIEWEEFWHKLFLAGQFDCLAEMDRECALLGRRVLFVIDGLEEILEQTLDRRTEKNAVSALCQNFLNVIKTDCKNIGCIVFLRKDMAKNSIEVNFEQFHALYKGVELKWSKTEALRLVLWLVNQSVSGFYTESIPIELASAEVIEGSLVKLWGNKLGKDTSNEAYSSRWILAALSDFNGQLQARDIIRFLQNATEEVGKSNYEDRYIMPTEIKKAVQKCSMAKIAEIKQEIKVLQPVLEKFENAPLEKRILPFYSDTFELSAKEEQLLRQEGYLRIENDKYYLPEIIRHALKFRYEKGARPKVLSLLLNK
ncbi:MAG: hypothetical protein HFH84_16215 [Lachnospiraceae bacterium]|nr:hypothetical protein [Lachnospiraceae bacterium]